MLLKQCATEEEANFLRSGGRPENWTGQRVELNAMTSQQFLDWLTGKLKEHGVEKVIPDEATLAAAYQRATLLRQAEAAVETVLGNLASAPAAPEGLTAAIRDKLTGSSSSWIDAVWAMTAANHPDDPDSEAA